MANADSFLAATSVFNKLPFINLNEYQTNAFYNALKAKETAALPWYDVTKYPLVPYYESQAKFNYLMYQGQKTVGGITDAPTNLLGSLQGFVSPTLNVSTTPLMYGLLGLGALYYLSKRR